MTKSKNIRLPTNILDVLETQAAQQKTTSSELIRRYINQGLDTDTYENSLSQITEVTEASLEKVIEPYMKRIIALIQKNGKIEAAAYFLLLNLLLNNPSNTRTTSEVIAACNKLAVDYIKQPNGDIEKYFSKTEELVQKALGLSRGMIFEED